MTRETPQGGFVDSGAPDQSETAGEEYRSAAATKVLTPARVASWRASSHDLLTGATVSEVDDTIPGDLFDELFKDSGAGM